MKFIIVLCVFFSCARSMMINPYREGINCFLKNGITQMVCGAYVPDHIEDEECRLHFPITDALKSDSIKIGGFGCNSDIMRQTLSNWREYDMSSIGAKSILPEVINFCYSYNPSLEKINASHNLLSGNIRLSIVGCIILKEIDLSSNQISTFNLDFTSNTQLQLLNLQNNTIKRIAPLMKLFWITLHSTANQTANQTAIQTAIQTADKDFVWKISLRDFDVDLVQSLDFESLFDHTQIWIWAPSNVTHLEKKRSFVLQEIASTVDFLSSIFNEFYNFLTAFSKYPIRVKIDETCYDDILSSETYLEVKLLSLVLSFAIIIFVSNVLLLWIGYWLITYVMYVIEKVTAKVKAYKKAKEATLTFTV